MTAVGAPERPGVGPTIALGGARPVLRPSPIWLDANALMLPFRERFPLGTELARLGPGRPIEVPDSVLVELRRLDRQGEPQARPALQLAARYPRAATDGSGDDAIVALARSRPGWVVTADRGLAERLGRAGITVLRPRGRTRLVIVPPGRAGAPPRTRARNATIPAKRSASPRIVRRSRPTT